MLVLSRKINEKILVGDKISIQVIGIKGNRVTLGIEAPQGVRVLRFEILPEDDNKNQQR